MPELHLEVVYGRKFTAVLEQVFVVEELKVPAEVINTTEYVGGMRSSGLLRVGLRTTSNLN